METGVYLISICARYAQSFDPFELVRHSLEATIEILRNAFANNLKFETLFANGCLHVLKNYEKLICTLIYLETNTNATKQIDFNGLLTHRGLFSEI